jgi:hypothetical protein
LDLEFEHLIINGKKKRNIYHHMGPIDLGKNEGRRV